MSNGQNTDLDQNVKELTSDEIRSKVVTDYGLDEITQTELIDKIVAKEVEHQNKFGTVIKQKIKHREEEEKLRAELAKKGNNFDEETFLKKVDERMEVRDLERSSLSDELKSEVKAIAKAKGISISQAANDSYIKFRMEEDERKKKNEAAAAGGGTGASYKGKDLSEIKATDFDLTTEAGKKAHAAYLEEIKKQFG